MAADGGTRTDFQSHEKSYSGFISLFKIGTAVSVVVAALVVLLIAS